MLFDEQEYRLIIIIVVDYNNNNHSNRVYVLNDINLDHLHFLNRPSKQCYASLILLDLNATEHAQIHVQFDLSYSS